MTRDCYLFFNSAAFGFAVVIIAHLIGCTTGPAPTDPQPPPYDGTTVAALLSLHNLERKAATAGPLSLNNQLMQAAQMHAEWMARTQRLSHVGSGGSTVSKRITNQGYRWRMAGENIAVGYTTAESVTTAWMRSTGHRDNILNAYYQDVGFGVARAASGKLYWCAVFATSNRSTGKAAQGQLFWLELPPGLDAADDTQANADSVLSPDARIAVARELFQLDPDQRLWISVGQDAPTQYKVAGEGEATEQKIVPIESYLKLPPEIRVPQRQARSVLRNCSPFAVETPDGTFLEIPVGSQIWLPGEPSEETSMPNPENLPKTRISHRVSERVGNYLPRCGSEIRGD